ncbi:MAG: helix-turn-helix domain-containing protein [Desulfococcaceae bacterium]
MLEGKFWTVFERSKKHKRDGKPLRKTILREASHPKEIREKLKLSQSAFASLMGVTPQTIQAWENGERTPRGPAKPLLRIAEQHPEIFFEYVGITGILPLI